MTTPRYLVRRKFLFVTIAFVVVFSLIYISIYRPYSDTFWLSLTNVKAIIPTLLYYLFAICILLSSKTVLIALQKSREPAGHAYLITVACEWILVSALYVFFSRFVVEPHLAVTLHLCLSSLFCVLTILLIPYTICVLYAAYKDKEEELAAMKSMTSSSEISIMYEELSHNFIDFRDTSGTLRLTVDADSVYYIESQDNYVNICYRLEDKLESYLLRCRIRDIDEMLRDKSFVRCHRSYIINPRHVQTFYCSNSAHGRLSMDNVKCKEIPVSRTYFQSLEDILEDSKLSRK